MTTSEEFHALPEQDQRKLVQAGQVVVGNRVLNEVPDQGTPVRILDRPLEEQVLDRLEQERHTVHSLAAEFKIDDQSVRQIINRYRRRHNTDLILDRAGVLRVKGYQKQWSVYTIEAIPFHARVADPTLVFSFFDEPFEDFPRLTQNIDAETVTELDRDYATIVGDYWGIEPEEALNYLTSYNRHYVETSLIPLPVLDAPARYDSVINRFQETERVYQRRDLNTDIITKRASIISDTHQRSDPGLLYYQMASIELFDLLLCARQEHTRLLPDIRQHIDSLLTRLYPSEETDVDEEYEAETSLEDELKVVLQDEPVPAKALIDRLPPHFEETSVAEVQDILDRFARLNLIEKNEDVVPPEYAEKKESWRGD